MCAEGGQLQLNAFEPTIGYCVLSSLRTLTACGEHPDAAVRARHRGRPERCRSLVEDSIGLVTALGPALGYEASSRVAKRRWPREAAGCRCGAGRESCSRPNNWSISCGLKP
jgi:aspartate ammonia-lyase